MAWVTDWAPTADELNSCIDCGLCLPACPTFRLTGDESASPRGRIAAMRAVAGGRVPLDARFAEIMDLCLQCRACETACPSLVPFGRMMEGARGEVAAHRPDVSTIGRRVLFGRLIGSRVLVALATSAIALAQRAGLASVGPGPLRRAAALRPIPIPVPTTAGSEWLPEGTPIGTVALLSGCVMDAWYPQTHVAVIQVLRTAGYRVVAPLNQTCCGALAAHEGAVYDAARLAERNTEAFEGYDRIVVDSAGCSAHMKGYRRWTDAGVVADRVVDANEFVAQLLIEGLLPAIEGEVPIGIQDPCHLRHAQRIVEAPRAILRAAGCVPVEIDPDGMCCGAAGAYQLTHPDVSDQLGRIKADQIAATGVAVVASPNPGCEMQLRAHIPPDVEVAHPIEVYWAALESRDSQSETTGPVSGRASLMSIFGSSLTPLERRRASRRSRSRGDGQAV
jgi:glycolate oxidase iron-sulfur subunit